MTKYHTHVDDERARACLPAAHGASRPRYFSVPRPLTAPYFTYMANQPPRDSLGAPQGLLQSRTRFARKAPFTVALRHLGEKKRNTQHQVRCCRGGQWIHSACFDLGHLEHRRPRHTLQNQHDMRRKTCTHTRYPAPERALIFRYHIVRAP